MADTRYLKRRYQGWYFQIAVPRAVREAYGSDVISVTLETRDLSIAQQRRWPKLVEYQDAFRKLAGGASPAADDERLSSVVLTAIDEIALASYHAALVKMDADARRGKGAREWREGADPIEQQIAGLSLYSDDLNEAA